VAAFILFVTLPVLLLAIGAILLGIASLRAGVFPKGAGTLLLVAGILALISLAIPFEVLQTILEALGLGCSSWRLGGSVPRWWRRAR
jgi:hypothetical protein